MDVTFGDYAVPGSCIHRLFLPLLSTAETSDQEPITSPWAPIAEAAGIALDAGVVCADMLGWGRGNGAAPSFRPALGRAPSATLEAVRQLLRSATRLDDRAGYFRPFDSPGRSGGGDVNDVPIGFEEFFHRWRDAPMPGSLRLGEDVLLDAPRYADSVIVSATEDLTGVGARLGLEIVRASASAPLPDMSW